MRKILIFDVPRNNNTLLKRIHRHLHQIRAEKLQHSVWVSTNLQKFKDIREQIKNNGGTALILNEDVVDYIPF